MRAKLASPPENRAKVASDRRSEVKKESPTPGEAKTARDHTGLRRRTSGRLCTDVAQRRSRTSVDVAAKRNKARPESLKTLVAKVLAGKLSLAAARRLAREGAR